MRKKEKKARKAVQGEATPYQISDPTLSFVHSSSTPMLLSSSKQQHPHHNLSLSLSIHVKFQSFISCCGWLLMQ